MRLIDADLLTQKVKGWLNTDPNSDSIMIDANESVACVLRKIEEQHQQQLHQPPMMWTRWWSN